MQALLAGSGRVFAARGIQITEARVGIVAVEGEGFVIVQEQLQVGGWNRKAQAFGEQQLHVGDADHFA